MPVYPWKCKKCGSQRDTIRSFEDYDVPPEEKISNPCIEGSREHDWERHIGTGQTHIHPPGYGSKGNW